MNNFVSFNFEITPPSMTGEFISLQGTDSIDLLKRKRERNIKVLLNIESQIQKSQADITKLQSAKKVVQYKQTVINACIGYCENSSPKCHYCSRPMNATRPLTRCFPCGHVYCTQCIDEENALYNSYREEEFFSYQPSFTCPKCSLDIVELQDLAF